MMRSRLVLLLLAPMWVGAAACANDSYVIGVVCPAADAAPSADPRCAPASGGTTLAVDFTTTGASALGPLALPSGNVAPPLPSGNVAPAWRLFGQGASPASWLADVGGSLTGTAMASANDAAPFTDGTRAAVLAATPSYTTADMTTGAVGADDFALEVVLRASAGATVSDKRAGAVGWSLQENAGGQLVLTLDDGAAPVVEIASESLTTNAWYHCLFWVSRAVGARVDCDGRMGAVVAVPSTLGTLDSSATIVAGGGAAVEVAALALFRVPAGGLGAASTWLGVGERRFAQLTGINPRVAGGTATPTSGVRDSEAYLDLETNGARALFLVGADWPRVACRVDSKGTRGCGYLSEPGRTRLAPTAPSAWQALELTLADRGPAFPAPELPFTTLVPSTTNASHALSFTGTLGAGANQILSFFANASGVASARVDVSAGGAGTAVFDVAAGTVITPPTAVGASATIEPWGGGTFRCSYAFVAPDGPSTYTLALVDATGNETFAGAGAGTIAIQGLQVDVGLAYAGSLLAADTQPPDRLTFVGNDGNLPAGTSGSVSVDVLLPAGKRITDQAMVNINNGGTFQDQVQLFVRGDTGLAGFWGLSTAGTHWTFDGPTTAPLVDGTRHAIVGSWNAAAARLAIDGAGATQAQMIANAPPIVLDRIDVGFSEASSGALEGLVSSLEIGAM